MASKIALYRPYFSAAELELITKWAEEAAAKNPENTELLVFYKKLKMTLYKVSNDIIKPVLTREKTTEEKLGLVQNAGAKPESEIRERLETLAMKHMNDPNSLSKEEIAEGKRLELLEYKMDMGMFS